jgi:hypothetical protein
MTLVLVYHMVQWAPSFTTVVHLFQIQVVVIHLTGTVCAAIGVHMQVAGAMAVVASGMSWAQLYTQRIRTPLGLPALTFYTPVGNEK